LKPLELSGSFVPRCGSIPGKRAAKSAGPCRFWSGISAIRTDTRGWASANLPQPGLNCGSGWTFALFSKTAPTACVCNGWQPRRSSKISSRPLISASKGVGRLIFELHNPIRRLPVQFLDFFRQPFRLLLQFGAFLIQQPGPFRSQFIQHAGLLFAELAKFVFGLSLN